MYKRRYFVFLFSSFKYDPRGIFVLLGGGGGGEKGNKDLLFLKTKYAKQN